MKYATIKDYDISNGLGIRISLFVSGCTHKCPGCFNEVAWDCEYGEEFDKNVEDKLIKMLEPSYIAGLTLLGGEPFEIENQRGLVSFIKRVRQELPHKTIWMYSGYLFDKEIHNPDGKVHCEVTDEILRNIDILVDGKFEISLTNLSLKFRGSTNQRIILVQESLEKNEVILSPLNAYKEFKINK